MVSSSGTSARAADRDVSTQAPGTAPLRSLADAASYIGATAASETTAPLVAPDASVVSLTCATDGNSDIPHNWDRIYGLLKLFARGNEPPKDLDCDTIFSITAMDPRKAPVPKNPSAKERAERYGSLLESAPPAPPPVVGLASSQEH
ncbi:hypothetical protein PI125_g19309 [Phytophthora idaei]|nr:hypothetical protein PI125_g19309 [Phytophthora idaei]KAG3129141.1 hypothetical protein PI126_g21097 [Phytophthora idaei]